MKAKLYLILFLAALWGCQKKEYSKTYMARTLKSNEEFNQFRKENEGKLKIYKYDDSVSTEMNTESKEKFGVKFNDTTLRIQTDLSDKNVVTDKFAFAQFVNTQKTCLLVQITGDPRFIAPFYLITLKNAKPEVISLFRPSRGKNDQRFTRGLERIGRSGYLINNDFFIATVNAKVYFIKRQNPEERIQGLHFINSPDKQTLVFLLPSSFYQVHYSSGEVFTQPLSLKAPKNNPDIYKWVQDNYSWQKNARGIYFLKADTDDKIVDISEFK